MAEDEERPSVEELIKQFPEWRRACAEQTARRNPYCTYVPETKHVVAMMDAIEMLASSRSVSHQSAPAAQCSLPSGESDPSVTPDFAGADTSRSEAPVAGERSKLAERLAEISGRCSREQDRYTVIEAVGAIRDAAPPPALDHATVERGRCIAICEAWIGDFQDKEIKFTSAREYAVDAIEDIIDLIREGYQPDALTGKDGAMSELSSPGNASGFRQHDLKTWPEFFSDLLSDRKSFELRKNDRGFRVGDELRLHEYDPNTKIFSGRVLIRKVTYMLEHRPDAGCAATFGLQPEYVILGIAVPAQGSANLGDMLNGALLDLVRLCTRDGVGDLDLKMEDVVVDGVNAGSWNLKLWASPLPSTESGST